MGRHQTLIKHIMKTIKLLIALFFAVIALPSQAQTADEIVANYIEATGGEEAWKSIKSMKMTGVANMGQEFPFTQTVMADGRMQIVIDLQGQKFVPQAFDGESMWTTNFQTGKAEAMDAEASAQFKSESQDIIDSFVGYKEKGYSLEKLEDKTIEGTDCFAVKLTKKPVVVDGKEEENFTTFFFDKETFVPVMSESTAKSGPGKGMTSQTVFSDYLEAGDVFYAHSITTKFNGQTGQSIKIKEIEVNGDVDESIFKMPTQ